MSAPAGGAVATDIKVLRERAGRLGCRIRKRGDCYLLEPLDGDGGGMGCGSLDGIADEIGRRERGDPLSVMSPCGSAGTVFMNDAEDTALHVERQEDGTYKKTFGSKRDRQTGETIQFDILEDGSHKETRRFPKEDDQDEIGAEIALPLADLAARINNEHQAASGALKQGVLHAIAAGDLLLKAKAQLKHGGWLDWLKANCEIPERTVQAYMRLARLPIEKRNAVADLPLREALSAIRSRQERLERAENRPPPGPAVLSFWNKQGELVSVPAPGLKVAPEHEHLLEQQMPQPAPPPPATPAQIADDLIYQLSQSLYEVRERVSVADLAEAFERRFNEHRDIVKRALALVRAMDDQQRRLFEQKMPRH
jgi:hypothetical protein